MLRHQSVSARVSDEAAARDETGLVQEDAGVRATVQKLVRERADPRDERLQLHSPYVATATSALKREHGGERHDLVSELVARGEQILTDDSVNLALQIYRNIHADIFSIVLFFDTIV